MIPDNLLGPGQFMHLPLPKHKVMVQITHLGFNDDGSLYVEIEQDRKERETLGEKWATSLMEEVISILTKRIAEEAKEEE